MCSGVEIAELAAGGGSAEVVGSSAEVVGGPRFTRDPCSVVEVPFSDGEVRRCTWRDTKYSSTSPVVTLHLNGPQTNGFTKQQVVGNVVARYEQRVDVGDGGFLITGSRT
jgi:hypothetical protein